MTIKGNGKLYASDYIYLEFVVIHPDAASAVLNRSAKSCYLTKPTGNAGKGANVKESDITATYNRDGTFHTRVKVNKIQLDSTEKVGFYLYIANSDSGIHAHIWIEDVYSVDSLAEKNVLNEQKNIESKSSLRGFKKSDALHAISDPKEAAAHQITLAQILKRNEVIDQIEFIESKDKEYTSYTTSSVAKVAKTENTIKMEKDMSVYCYTQTAYHAGKKDFEWGNKELKKGHEYSIKYTFVYYPKLSELWYRVTYDDLTTGDTDDGDRAEELDNELLEDIEDSEDYITGIMRIAISKLAGEERKVYDAFHDVLSDVGFYSNIKDINSSDAQEVENKVGKVVAVIQEVENKVGKVVAVITNIGLVLAIVIPAILGVKYMIGSAEDKAEYKKDMVPYLVGAVLLFSICTFVKILQTLGNQINKI